MAILYLLDSGLALGDIDDRWYAGSTAITRPASAAMSELSAGVYTLTADPLEIEELLHVTWSYGGYYGTARWPENNRAPGEVIIPVRDPGLLESDFALVLISNETLDPTSLDFEEIGVGDYAVSGWPIGGSNNEYQLLWTYAAFQHSYTWRDSQTVVAGDIAETVARRMLSTYLAEAFLGPTLTGKTYCPFVSEGLIFDLDNSTQTAPFTPQEVHNDVGYVVMTLFTNPSREQRFASGTRLVGGVTKIFSIEQTDIRAEFEVVIPLAKDIAIGEVYTELLKTKLRGVVLRSQVPDVLLRNLPAFPIECGEWREGEDASFSSRLVTVYLERTEPVVHAGLQEVIVP
jgi:hypothetical protein